MGEREVPMGEIPRADVAATLVAVLHDSRTIGRQLQLVGGDTPIATAIDALVQSKNPENRTERTAMNHAPETQQLTDQEQIRHLIDAYAHNADRRNPAAQAALFTEDGRVTVYGGDPAVSEPAQVVTGRAELEAAFSGLSAYDGDDALQRAEHHHRQR